MDMPCRCLLKGTVRHSCPPFSRWQTRPYLLWLGGPPSRIDHIWATRSLLGHTTQAGVVREIVSHPHLPVTCRLQGQVSRGLHTSIAPPLEGTIDRQKAEIWHSQDALRWNELLRHAYSHNQLEEVMVTLSRKWEHFWRTTTGTQLQGGRGKLAEADDTQGHRRRGKLTLIADSARLLVGRLKAVRKHASDVALVENLERKISVTISKSPFVERSAELSAANPIELRLLCAQEMFEALAKTTRKDKAAEWRRALEAPNGSLLARHLKGFRELPLTMLESADPGSDDSTCDPHQVADRIGAFWKDYHCPPDPRDVDLEQLDAFLGHCPRHEFDLPEITPEEVAKSIAALKGRTATGPDGWRAVDVKKLPSQFASDLATFFSALESSQRWPVQMNRAWLAPIPKGKRRCAEETRPIAIFGTWYRLWSSTRSRALRTWMEHVLPPEQSAYRTGRSAEDEALGFDRFIEQHAQDKVMAIAIDLSKAFDGVNHQALLRIWDHLGLTPQSVQRLRVATMTQSRRWCIASRYLGSEYQVTSGLAQGCAVSVCSFNAYVCPLIWLLHNLPGEKCVVSYADDLVVASTDQRLLRRMSDLIVTYMRIVALKINPKKCAYGVWGRGARFAPATFQIQDDELPPSASFDVLGVTIDCVTTPFENKRRSEERAAEAKRRAVVLRNTKLSWKCKSRAVASMVNPLTNYGVWRAGISRQMLRKRRTILVETVHGKVGKGARAAEFLTCFFCPAHLVDPFGSALWKLLRAWYTTLQHEQDIDVALGNALGKNPHKKGPLASLASLWREMGLAFHPEDQMFTLQGEQINLHGQWDAGTQHTWRCRIRAHMVSTLKGRRADMVDLEIVDYKALERQQNLWNGPSAALLRGIQAGGTTTPDRTARQAYGERVRCTCDQGYADFAHIMWDCPLVTPCRTYHNPDDFSIAEQRCAIPIAGKPPHVQDALARQAVQTLMRWHQIHPKHGPDFPVPDDDDGAHNNGRGADDNQRHEDAPNGNDDNDLPDEPPSPRVDPEIWIDHPHEQCLLVSRNGLRIKCRRCGTEARSDGIRRHVRRHGDCKYSARVTPNGCVPKALPNHMCWQKGEDGIRYIICRRCGTRAHYTLRSVFVGRHTFCLDDMRSVACSMPGH